MGIHPTFHVSLLERAQTPKLALRNQEEPLTFEARDGGEEYEVRTIKGHNEDEYGEREYLVAWKGYTSEEDSWEPAANISQSAMRAYNQRIMVHKGRKRRRM